MCAGKSTVIRKYPPGIPLCAGKMRSYKERKGTMNTAKRKNIFKKVLVFTLMLSFVLGQFTPVQAAAGKTKYTIALNKQVYTMKKGKA